MRVGLLTVTLRLPGVSSLKEKRAIVRHLVASVARRGTAVAVAEIDELDEIQRATLRIAHLSNDVRRTESVLSKALEGLGKHRDVGVLSSDLEIL